MGPDEQIKQSRIKMNYIEQMFDIVYQMFKNITKTLILS